ncbi:MAG: hypothetical protein JSU00_27615 [Acidobacteria bacterium]|nr:hypothetical protein [Acidobacteriota bacterium]
MRRILIALTFLGCVAAVRNARTKLVFPARPGDVAFDHAQHTRRAGGDCGVCHNRLFPQDAKAPLNWKQGTHRPAEAKGLSCGACHRPGGKAFPTRDNCRRCHSTPPDL